MRGVFIKKRFWSIWCLLCGLFLMGLFIFLRFADSQAGNEAYVGIVLGAIICIVSMISLLFNASAYFYIDNDRIYAKYHWFGKIDCDVSEVAFALAQINTLTILLKNGKRHVIMGIENSWPLASAIRQQIFTVETEQPDALLRKLEAEQAARKKKLFWVLGGCVMLFVNILIAAFLTDNKEMYDFNKTDWILFSIMSVIEILTLIITFYFAGQCGKHLLPIELLKYRLKGAYIASQPLPAGKAIRICTNEDLTGRIIVFSFPRGAGFYYCVQHFIAPTQLETVYDSQIFESEEDLPNEELSMLIDISSQFCK